MSGEPSFFIDWFPRKPIALESGRRYRIGRGGGNEFYLPDVRASREHADICGNGGAFVLADLKSSNGTYLNGQLLAEPTVLKDGDEIQVGEHVLRVRVENARRVAQEYEETKEQVEEWQTVVDTCGGTSYAAEGGISGAIETVGLPQVVQMLETGRKSGRLLVTAVGVSGSICMEEGRIVGAETGSADAPDAAITGAEAVYALLAVEQGVFEFLPRTSEAEPQTKGPVIEETTPALLMEGLRRLDENRRGGPIGIEDTQKF